VAPAQGFGRKRTAAPVLAAPPGRGLGIRTADSEPRAARSPGACPRTGQSRPAPPAPCGRRRPAPTPAWGGRRRYRRRWSRRARCCRPCWARGRRRRWQPCAPTRHSGAAWPDRRSAPDSPASSMYRVDPMALVRSKASQANARAGNDFDLDQRTGESLPRRCRAAGRRLPASPSRKGLV
jgi:hypothetical protein